MNSLVFSLLLAAPDGGGAAAGGGGAFMQFLPFIAIIGIFYFLIIRPQSKKQKETKKMLDALKKGDKVVTIGGVHGTIQTVKESSVVLRVDDSTKIEFSRSAIANVLSVSKEEKVEEKAEEKVEPKKIEKAEEKKDEAGESSAKD